MIKRIRVRYYFTNGEKKRFKKWLVDKEMTLIKAADQMGISVSLLVSILNGNRAITMSTLEKFKEIGFEIITDESENNYGD